MRLTFFALASVLVAGAGCGRERPKKDMLRGIIRSENQNFHVTFTR